MNDSLAIGSLVTAEYKTGEYIGEIVEMSSASKAAVKILAVLKHPTQGDLHNPMNPDVAFFHQRRALAFGEIALMPLYTIKPYRGEVPDYAGSLKKSLDLELHMLRQTVKWAERSIQELEQLKSEYSV
ncbi:kinase-associated lipoprotein B [Paenibacillus doosanensis]|uniref:Kinase-associated lipoprotein B n=1 Tax=Paenibacillus konkukensis TaxID=2020716 RepID=A0ABY4RJU9_9BACL|nr:MULTISPECIES: kinase-associated lipoprotein B [Paenibacillus]MCS7461111.1 kinase-associated lipoprotein B [Paenibacillus doosanensis]UQZ81607.1 Kinase-associated lipoprotein B precursor [Paenibacillus konkukensis]